jgi:hypothetical protein
MHPVAMTSTLLQLIPLLALATLTAAYSEYDCWTRVISNSTAAGGGLLVSKCGGVGTCNEISQVCACAWDAFEGELSARGVSVLRTCPHHRWPCSGRTVERSICQTKLRGQRSHRESDLLRDLSMVNVRLLPGALCGGPLRLGCTSAGWKTPGEPADCGLRVHAGVRDRQPHLLQLRSAQHAAQLRGGCGERCTGVVSRPLPVLGVRAAGSVLQ